MVFFKPKGWEANGFKTFGGVPFLFDIVFAEVDIPFMYTSSDYIRDGTSKQKSFEDRIGELRDYKSEHGDCKVPVKFLNRIHRWDVGVSN